MKMGDESLPIDHVLNGVYISGWRVTNFAVALRRHEITHILKLYEHTPYFPPDFLTLDNPIEDGVTIPPEKLRRGVEFITHQVSAAHSVLVMCGAGISRSSTFVLAYMLEQGYDLHDAYKLLRSVHSEAAPHMLLWGSLFAQYGLKYTLNDALDWMHDSN